MHADIYLSIRFFNHSLQSGMTAHIRMFKTKTVIRPQNHQMALSVIKTVKVRNDRCMCKIYLREYDVTYDVKLLNKANLVSFSACEQ